MREGEAKGYTTQEAMANSIIISSITPLDVQTKAIGCISLQPPSFRRQCHFATPEKPPQDIKTCKFRNLRFMAKNSRRNLTLDSVPILPSPSDMVNELYKYINEKKLWEMNEIISEDCCFEDFSFPEPFNGKKEVMLFFQQLMASMGKNIKFKIRNIEEDDDTAWVNWHLEWKEKQIPFTRGCSLYECAKEGDKLVIRKAQVIIESPIKPGGLVLVLLKIVASLFDDFPKATERFLKSPHVILQWIERTYTVFLAPFINPLIETYLNFWKFIAHMLAYVLAILIFTLKIFFN